MTVNYHFRHRFVATLVAFSIVLCFARVSSAELWDFSGAQDLQGWTVFNGAAVFIPHSGGGVGAANDAGGFATSHTHDNFLIESPAFNFQLGLEPGDRALTWISAGGQGDQTGAGDHAMDGFPGFKNPAEVVAYNGGRTDINGDKGLSFLNMDTGQYDATLYNIGNAGVDTYELTMLQLFDAGVLPGVTYKLNYWDADDDGWGQGILNSVDVVTGAPIPEPSTLVLAAFGLLGLCGWAHRRRRRA